MNRAINMKNTVTPVKVDYFKLLLKNNIFVFVLVFFIVMAAMQAIQLEAMRSEAKSLSQDINGIQTEQKVLHEQYSVNSNNSSYYSDN